MKRSHESSEELTSKKYMIDSSDFFSSNIDSSNNDSSNDNSTESSSISSNQSEINDNIHCFFPNNIERQIVRMTLSRIRSTNMYDWDIENSTDVADYMVLRDFGTIFNPESRKEYSCELYITLKYNWEITFCEIQCCYNNDIIRLSINWDTPIDSPNIFYINKTIEQTSYLVFTRNITQECKIDVTESHDHAWCYFMDNRYHLDRICP